MFYVEERAMTRGRASMRSSHADGSRMRVGPKRGKSYCPEDLPGSYSKPEPPLWGPAPRAARATPCAGAIAPAGLDFEVAWPYFAAAGQDFEAAGTNMKAQMWGFVGHESAK